MPVLDKHDVAEGAVRARAVARVRDRANVARHRFLPVLNPRIAVRREPPRHVRGAHVDADIEVGDIDLRRPLGDGRISAAAAEAMDVDLVQGVVERENDRQVVA